MYQTIIDLTSSSVLKKQLLLICNSFYTARRKTGDSVPKANDKDP